MFPSNLEKEFEENSVTLHGRLSPWGPAYHTRSSLDPAQKRAEKTPYRARNVSIQLPGHSDFRSWSYWIRLSMTAQSLMFTMVVILVIPVIPVSLLSLRSTLTHCSFLHIYLLYRT